jgi:hypothetical protein
MVPHWFPKFCAAECGYEGQSFVDFHQRVSTTSTVSSPLAADGVRVVAILYMATQTLYAGYLMDVCLRCVFGQSWMNIANTLPASSGTTSRKLLAFFILCESSSPS